MAPGAIRRRQSAASRRARHDEMRKLVDTFPKSVAESFFIVRTAIEPNLQRYAEHEVKSALRSTDTYGASQSALVIADSTARCGRWSAAVGYSGRPVQPRGRRAAATRLVVQALRLREAALASGQFTPQSIVVELAGVSRAIGCPTQFLRRVRSMTLTQAITNSVNIIPVKLSIALRQSQARPRGSFPDRAQFQHLYASARHAVAADARADEVECARARRTRRSPNLGKVVAPHTPRSKCAAAIWCGASIATAAPKGMSPKVALDMIGMMNSVVDEPRAQLDAGRRQNRHHQRLSRDAWFVGYTGNFSGAVWMGNRRLSTDQAHDRRHHPGADLAQRHGLCAWASNCNFARACRRRSTLPLWVNALRSGIHAATIVLTRKGTESIGARRALARRGNPRPAAAAPACRHLDPHFGALGGATTQTAASKPPSAPTKGD